MPLREAGNEWLETRRPFLDPHTVLDYGLYISTLVRFFGNVPLEQQLRRLFDARNAWLTAHGNFVKLAANAPKNSMKLIDHTAHAEYAAERYLDTQEKIIDWAVRYFELPPIE